MPACYNRVAGPTVRATATCWALLGLLTLVLSVAACGGVAAAPAAPDPYPDTYEGLIECVYDNMAGSLTRPRSQHYAQSPYLTDLDPQATIVGGQVSASEEAWLPFEPLLEASGGRCAGVRTYPSSELGLAGRKALELQAIGIMFIVALIGALSPDMAHNCAVWQEELRPYKVQSADAVGISQRVPERWQAFSVAWDRAASGIDQECAVHGAG